MEQRSMTYRSIVEVVRPTNKFNIGRIATIFGKKTYTNGHTEYLITDKCQGVKEWVTRDEIELVPLNKQCRRQR